jgi:beta-glucanase (GH16 family)
MECFIEWAGYHWMNGQPWGVAHPNTKYVWYASEKCTRKYADAYGMEIIEMTVNDEPKYFDGDVNHIKDFGGGCISTYETFQYGHFHFEYVLPIGIHLWPAIWLSGVDSWPPEIDIVEGWSGDGIILRNKPNYRKIAGFNNIVPGVFYGHNIKHKSYGSLGFDNVTFECYQKLDGMTNTCDLYWYPDNISVFYNGHKMMDIKDNDILKELQSKMYICIDVAAGNNFTRSDYKKYLNEGSPMKITEFTYGK